MNIYVTIDHVKPYMGVRGVSTHTTIEEAKSAVVFRSQDTEHD
jgi:hypothetical protein